MTVDDLHAYMKVFLAIAMTVAGLMAAKDALARPADEACDQETADALVWMSYARDTHVWWADYGSNYPDEVRKWVGEPALHREWVGRYETVMRLLKRGCDL